MAQQGAGILDAIDVGWVVQWRQRDELLDLSDHLVVDKHRLGEGRTTVHDTVANRDEVQVLRTAAQQGHHAECTLQAHRVGQDRAGVLHLRGGRGDLDVALRLADLLDDAGDERLFVRIRIRVQDLELDGRGTGVQNQDEFDLACCWIVLGGCHGDCPFRMQW